MSFLFEGDLKEKKKKLTFKLRINYFFINSKLPDVSNSADLQMRHQKLFTLARHLSVGHFE